jgi:hypothetical protein
LHRPADHDQTEGAVGFVHAVHGLGDRAVLAGPPRRAGNGGDRRSHGTVQPRTDGEASALFLVPPGAGLKISAW